MRTTVDKVTEILDNTTLDEDVITSFINSANVFVTDTLAGKGLSAVILAEIERWLAAHMIASTRERTAKEEGAGGAKIVYSGEWGSGLLSTSYGQTAVIMDTSLTLSALAKGKQKASVFAVTSFS
jgi:hypothetical protein